MREKTSSKAVIAHLLSADPDLINLSFPDFLGQILSEKKNLIEGGIQSWSDGLSNQGRRAPLLNGHPQRDGKNDAGTHEEGGSAWE